MATNIRTFYTCFLTPLISDTGVYAATATDISDRIKEADLGNLKRSIDSGDYDVGVYVYGSINLKVNNEGGLFNDVSDSRSLFTASRNKAKIQFKYNEIDVDGVTVSTVRFEGLINDEATRANIEKDEIRFKVLSRDSVIRDTKVAGQAVPNGATAKAAIETILNVSDITNVLTFSAANINPDLNFIIDDGSKFDNLTTKKALDKLLLASNSVFVLDSSFNMIVKSRAEDATADVINLFGKYDIHGRENIGKIKGYTTGRHRQFTSVKVNDTEKSNTALVNDFGVRQKEITLDFITSTATETDIANRLLAEFAVPKIEFSVEVPTELVKDADLLDRISLNYPLRVVPFGGNRFFPTIGITKVGETTEPLPDTFGSIAISPNLAFKIISIKESTKKFFTELKLRQVGTTQSDGLYNVEGNAIIGFAVIGEAVIAAGGDGNYWTNATLGAGRVGFTKVA